jgi:hypothetical protein
MVCFFPSGFPTKILYAFLIFHACYMPRPSHPLHFMVRIIFGETYKLGCNFLHAPPTFSLLGPNILLSTLLSNTLNLCSSHSVRDQVSHSYKTTGKIMFLSYTVDQKFSTFKEAECSLPCSHAVYKQRIAYFQL